METSSTINQGMAIENSIRHRMKEGLTMEEALEYEANVSRTRQLEAKMNKMSSESKAKNQYTASKSSNHA